MSEGRDARVALSLIEGVAQQIPEAEAMLVEAFDSQEDAAAAFAYLAGFLIEVVAASRGETVEESIRSVRRML